MEKACFHSTSGHCLGPAPAQPQPGPQPSPPCPSPPLLLQPHQQAQPEADTVPRVSRDTESQSSPKALPRFCSTQGSLLPASLQMPRPFPLLVHPTPSLPCKHLSTHACTLILPWRPGGAPGLASHLVLWAAVPPLWASSPRPGVAQQLPGLLLSSSHFQPLSPV